MPEDPIIQDNIPPYEQKVIEMRAFLVELNQTVNPMVSRIQIRFDSIFDYRSIMEELALYRNGLRNVSTFEVKEGLLLKDFFPDNTLEQLVDYVVSHIESLENDMEALDPYIDTETSAIQIALYLNSENFFTDRCKPLELIRSKVTQLGGQITRIEKGVYLESVLHNPVFVDIVFDNHKVSN